MTKQNLCESATRYLSALNHRIQTEIDNYLINVSVGDFSVDSCTSYVVDRLQHVQDQIRESIRRIDDYENDGNNTD